MLAHFHTTFSHLNGLWRRDAFNELIEARGSDRHENRLHVCPDKTVSVLVSTVFLRTPDRLLCSSDSSSSSCRHFRFRPMTSPLWRQNTCCCPPEAWRRHCVTLQRHSHAAWWEITLNLSRKDSRVHFLHYFQHISFHNHSQRWWSIRNENIYFTCLIWATTIFWHDILAKLSDWHDVLSPSLIYMVKKYNKIKHTRDEILQKRKTVTAKSVRLHCKM